jgi:hypothetical protein
MIHCFTQLNVDIQTSNKQTKCFWVGWMEEHPHCCITHYALDAECKAYAGMGQSNTFGPTFVHKMVWVAKGIV